MKSTIVTALTGCFVYGGILLLPTSVKADTLQDMVAQLNSASRQLQDLQKAGWPSIDTPLETEQLPVEPTYETYTLKMSGYNPDPRQTDDTPRITSIGADISEVIAARSQDLADELPYGTVIDILPATTTPNCGYKYVSDKIGLRVIGDAMNVKHKNWIDIFFEEDRILAQGGLLRNPAKALGMCSKVRIVVVGTLDLYTNGKIDPKKVRNLPKTQTALSAAVGLASLALK